jgi:glycerol 2-dehydrogenase (NADP+)
VDLLLVHWTVGLNPNGNHELLPTRPDGTRDVDPEFDIIKTWRQFEAVLASGNVKSIGVSNFSVPNLELLLEHVHVLPVANQIENHSLLPQTEVKEFCKKHEIIVQAYSPFAPLEFLCLRMKLFKSWQISTRLIQVIFSSAITLPMEELFCPKASLTREYWTTPSMLS